MKKAIALFLISLLFSQAKAASYQVIKDGPLHEAYVVQEFGTLILETVPTQPPKKITEFIPNQEDSQSIWIPGYWGWSQKYGQYLWVTGVWRRPPPGHHWVPGYWKSLSEEEWVWVRGYWSASNDEQTRYIPNPPPDPIEETVDDIPSDSEKYYWVPGYWQYDFQEKVYVWYSGRWEMFDPHWVYVPPQYIWREKGYILVPAFWDWPMDDRGLPFASIFIDDPETLEFATYKPVDTLQQLVVMQNLFPYWPNYYCLFRFHYFYHHKAWESWGAAPPWWNWPTWWTFSWPSLWWLWWWWSHPGYPNPEWVDAETAKVLTPPPPFVLKMMQEIQPPVNVTPNGVVGNQNVIEALEMISGKKLPILPADSKQIIQIQEAANPKTVQPPYLRPQGVKNLLTPLQKPPIGIQNFNQRKVELPPLPQLSPSFISAFEEERAYISQNPDTVERLPRKPSLTPLSPYTPKPRWRNWPRTPSAERAQPQPSGPQQNLPHPEMLRHWQTPQHLPTPPYHYPHLPHLPPHGYTNPAFKRPLTPPQTEHHDYFMSHPQPLRNPEGPKAYQVPGDYSTLPYQ